MPPKSDQIEITLFGPGYGESVLLHLGNNHWIIIDSCIDSASQKPAPLTYFQNIGVNPGEAVRLIIATHWHDDHIRGLSRILVESKNASFCCSAALTHQEFIATVLDYQSKLAMSLTSGLNEIFQIYQELQTRPKPKCTPIYAISNRKIYSLPSEHSGHGDECQVWSLSPSDKQYIKFLEELKTLMPIVKSTKKRAISQRPNHISVVNWINIGDMAMLLGADLEESNDEELGWPVIISSPEKPKGKASIFKVPHHGSKTAHNEMVWQQMIAKSNYAILSPYNRGGKLPTPEDTRRIMSYTDNAYTTSKLKIPKYRKERASSVVKTIRETVGKIRSSQLSTGWVRLRNGGRKNPHAWFVELSENACHLDQIYS